MSQTETQFRLVILRKMCQNAEFFWSIFSRIRTEYGEILRMRENMDQKKLSIWTLFTQ